MFFFRAESSSYHLAPQRTASRLDETFHVQQYLHAGGDVVARFVSRQPSLRSVGLYTSTPLT